MKCVIIGLGNGLLPFQHQVITKISADLLPTEVFGTNFIEISIKLQQFFIKKIGNAVYKMSPSFVQA